jgi:hypothetical protein
MILDQRGYGCNLEKIIHSETGEYVIVIECDDT